MDLDLDILSPEKTVISYRLAGLSARIVSHIVDAILIVVIMFAVALSSAALGVVATSSLVQTVLLVVFSFFPFLYFILLEGFWNGQTLGKKMSGLRVRMADGTPVTLFAATVRNVMRPADMIPLPYFSGAIAMFLNPRLQRIGDLVAGTVVVFEPKALPLINLAPHRVGVHPLEHLVGDLRKMRDDEYRTLRRYCDRFPFLPQEAQTRLTDGVWVPLAERLDISLPRDVHPVYLAEATVMKYGRERGLL